MAIADNNDITRTTRTVEGLGKDYPENAVDAVIKYLHLSDGEFSVDYDKAIISVNLTSSDKHTISVHPEEIDWPLIISEDYMDNMGKSTDSYVLVWRHLQPQACMIIGCLSKGRVMKRGEFKVIDDQNAFVVDWRKFEPIDALSNWINDMKTAGKE